MANIQSVVNISRNFMDIENQASSIISPKYTLDYYGSDLVEHNGPMSIELLCSQCSKYQEFNTLNVVVVTHEIDEITGTSRDFFSTAVCSYCNAAVQVRCFDYDFDPDYYFDYVTHNPKRKVSLEGLELPEPVDVLMREAIDLHNRKQYVAFVVISAELVHQVLKDQNVYSNDMKKGLVDLKLPIPLNVLEQFTTLLTSDIHKEHISAHALEEVLIICNLILCSLYSK